MPPPATPDCTLRRSEVAFVAALGVAAVALVLARPDKAIDYRVYWENARHYFGAGAAMYGPASGTGWAGGVFRYPPIFLDLFRPLAALPFALGLALWTAAKMAWAGWLALRLRQRWGLASVFALWPGMLLLAPYWIQELRYGNAQFLIVAMVVTAFLLAEERPGWAGGWLGFACALKVWPLFFFPCLLARRRWRRLLGPAGVSALGWTVLPVLWRGRGQVRLLAQWLGQERAIAATSARFGELWYPGQSLHDVLARYLSVVDYSQLADAHYAQIAWLHCAPMTVQWIWLGLAGALGLGLLAMLWRVEMTSDAAAALAFCGLVLLEPHVHRIIYVTLLWPAMWLAARGRRPWWFTLAVAAAVGEPLIPGGARQRALQVYGVDFWLVLVPLCVGVALAVRQTADFTAAAGAAD